MKRRDSKYVNLQWSSVKETMTWPFDIGKGKTVEVEVPCLILSKDVSIDTELRVWARTQEATKRMAVEIAGKATKAASSKVAKHG